MNYLDLSKFSSCSCGTNVESVDCLEQNSYSLIGWFFWSMGTTAIPRNIKFTCKKCNLVFENISNRELIKYYMLNQKK